MLPIEPQIEVPDGWRRIVYAENQKEYLPLPAVLEESETGHAITCWQLTWRERLKFLLTGKLWLTLLTFHKPLQPVMISTDRPEFS